MRTIHKYELSVLVKQPQAIYMRDGATILSVQEQDGVICVWVLVDTLQPLVQYFFSIFGTGQPLPDGFNPFKARNRHLATVQQGSLVWHVFGGTANHPNDFLPGAIK